MPTFVITIDKRTNEAIRVTRDGADVPWSGPGVTDRKSPFFLVSRAGSTWKLRQVDVDGTTTLVPPGSLSVVQGEPVETKPKETKAKRDPLLPLYQITTSGNLNLPDGRTFTGFESDGKSQGDIHFEKHGHELGASSKAEYIRLAKKFGADTEGTFADFVFGTTFVRCDLETCKLRRVFIAHGRHIRTFYVWSHAFAREPFAFAIAYTIERVAPAERERRSAWHAELAGHGINYLRACHDIDMSSAVNTLWQFFRTKSYVDDVDAAVQRWMPDIVRAFGGIPTSRQVTSWCNTAWIDD